MQIPANIVTDLSSTTAEVINGSLPLIIIILGIGIAFFVIRNIIGLLPK
jgi:hypothetical protein